MNDAKKKRAERYFFETLRQSVADFPSAEHIIREFEESPDFALRTAGGLLGIEVTKLFQHNTGRRRDVDQQRVANKSRQLSVSAGLTGIQVSLLFFETDLSKADVELLPEKLVAAVRSNLPYQGRESLLTSEKGQGRSVFLS